jgi:hypothetical protein
MNVKVQKLSKNMNSQFQIQVITMDSKYISNMAVTELVEKTEISKLQEREFEIECDGEVVKLRPVKVWVLAPRGRKGVVIGLFKCPNGKTVRKAIAKTKEPVD